MNMRARMSTPQSLADPLRRFVGTEGIDVDIVVDAAAAVQIQRSRQREACTVHALFPGGWIACETARASAAALGLSPGQMGKLLNHLDIRVRRCGLGCFE